MPMTATAPAPASRARLARCAAMLRGFPRPILQLLFRLAIASVFLRAGLNKLASWELTVQLFRDEYKVPVFPAEVAATMATVFEIGCSLLLIVGLLTRVATIPLLGILAVIQLFVYPSAWSEHLVWGSILLFLLTRGGGTFSLDRAIGLEPPVDPER
jgi:putative oxidoreductase